MSDKKVSEPELSSKNTIAAATDKSETEKTAKLSPTVNKTSEKTSATKPAKSASQKSTDNPPEKKPSNKTAIFALTVASLSVLASIGHFIWQQQQKNTQLLAINQQTQQILQQGNAQLKSTLSSEFQRQLALQKDNSQSKQAAEQALLDSEAKIQQLTAQVNQLEQQVQLRQPSDWLIHEAEYLVRVAARTMWLEQDTKAAIGLLRDADNRLQTLNQPKFLPVRSLINEDIEALALMPRLQNQEAILTLMALNKQVPNLEFAGVNLAEALNDKEDLSLSDDVSDWQENLGKTWQKFLNDFITVRRRSGMVEPLMAPEQQQHLKQNLSLKLQLVQWAASEQKSEVYQQTLLDIQQWLNEFFDMDLPVNQKFYQAIEQLKKQTIHYDYPSDLRSLAEIKRLLTDNNQLKQQATATKPQRPEGTTQQVLPEVEAADALPKEEKANDDEASGGQL
ncbi:uroporphyrinogen-III C-methyltransferase [Colwelliaceae bacterium MEBiC 14330]